MSQAKKFKTVLLIYRQMVIRIICIIVCNEAKLCKSSKRNSTRNKGIIDPIGLIKRGS